MGTFPGRLFRIGDPIFEPIFRLWILVKKVVYVAQSNDFHLNLGAMLLFHS